MAIYWDSDVTLVGDLPSRDLEVRFVAHGPHLMQLLVRLKYYKLEHFDSNLGQLLHCILYLCFVFFSGCDVPADWLIRGLFSSVMPRGRLWVCKRKKKAIKKNHCFFPEIKAAENSEWRTTL